MIAGLFCSARGTARGCGAGVGRPLRSITRLLPESNIVPDACLRSHSIPRLPHGIKDFATERFPAPARTTRDNEGTFLPRIYLAVFSTIMLTYNAKGDV